MKFGSLCALVLLAACAQDIYFREGATLSEVRRAEDACNLEAQNAAPFRAVTRVLPGRFIPEQRICDAGGNCTIRPAYQEMPRIETYDGNAEKRTLIARRCMAERGYDRVSLPYCDSAVRAAAPAAITRTLPRLSERSCIIPRGQAGYQIVTPAP